MSEIFTSPLGRVKQCYPLKVKALLQAALAGGALAAVLALGACGESHTGHNQAAEGDGIDLAFAAQMIEHHQGAIEMAELVKQESARPQVQRLSENIIATQQEEIEQMRRIQSRLREEGVKPADLGLSDPEIGMDEDHSKMADAKDFNRSFLEMMTAHHQGAVKMAEVEIDKGENPQLKRLAARMIRAQNQEIAEMKEWYMQWYKQDIPEAKESSVSHSSH